MASYIQGLKVEQIIESLSGKLNKSVKFYWGNFKNNKLIMKCHIYVDKGTMSKKSLIQLPVSISGQVRIQQGARLEMNRVI